MSGFVQEVFRLFGGGPAPLPERYEPSGLCSGVLPAVVEHVVDRTYSRFRAIPGYAKRLQGPVFETFCYIDQLVESVPEPILCSRSRFTEDPRVNAFFVDPKHMQEVFSESAELRGLLETHPDVDECWALLCMRKEERQQPGMSVVGDSVRKDVMQTVISFTDHQLLSPGRTEQEARRTLKCCIFDGLLSFMHKRADSAKATVAELENRLKSLRGRLQKENADEDADDSRERLLTQIDTLEREFAQQDLRLSSLEDHLEYVADVLAHPAQYLTSRSSAIRMNRMGVKLDGHSEDAGYEVALTEIRIAATEPRVGALVRFPRSELLPRQDFLTRADSFLAL
jgi:hypothetical protein